MHRVSFFPSSRLKALYFSIVCQKGWPTSHKIAQQLLIAPPYSDFFSYENMPV